VLEELFDDDLIGTWSWEANEEFRLHFLDDGIGARNWLDINVYEEFYWYVFDGSIIKEHLDGNVEMWAYSISGDYLTIESGSERYVYIRN